MVALLALSMLLGAEPTLPIPLPGRGGTVAVAVEPETFDAVATPNETFIVWADQRRAEGLLTGTQVTVPSAELWVQGLDGGLAARPWCQGVPVTSARMAITSGGRLGVAARRSDDTLTLAVLNLATGQFEGNSCGRTLGVTTGRPAIDAVGANLTVVFERDGGLWSMTVAPPPALLAPARPLSLPEPCTQPVISGAVEGGLCPTAMGPIQLTLQSGPISTPTEPATAFSLVGADGVVRVDAVGDVFLQQIGQGTVLVGRSVAGRQPLVAVSGGRPVVAFETPDASTALWVSGLSTSVAGQPVGLAVGTAGGVVMTQHTNGAVRGNDFRLSSSASLVPPGEGLAVARVLQRRPSVAWWDERQQWVVAWEEAIAPKEWLPRAARITAGGALTVHPIARSVDWLRVTRRPDGGLLSFGTLRQRTAMVDWFDGGVDLNTIPFIARDVVAGAQTEFSWSDPESDGTHLEFVARRQVMASGAVTCAAATSTGFTVTRATSDGGVFVQQLSETGVPIGGLELLGPGALAGCVASRPGAEDDVGFAYVTPTSVVFEDRTTPVLYTRSVPVTGASGLRLAALGRDGWLLAWSADAGVFAAVVEPDAPLATTLKLNVDAVINSDPSVVAAPTGQAAVVWAALYGDSVEGRLVLVNPTVPNTRTDGGVLVGDAGVGDGGVDDAGVGDAGVDGLDGGGVVAPVVRFVPTCGCDAAPMSLLMVLAVLVARRWRRGG